MASQKQIDANRINARKSTGPRSPEGKAASKRNRLTHGIRAEEHVLPGEDPAEFRRFVDDWADDWKPATMAGSNWSRRPPPPPGGASDADGSRPLGFRSDSAPRVSPQ